MATIHVIKGGKTSDESPTLPAPNETLVEYLTEALEKAKSGEIQAASLAFVNYDESITTCFDNGPLVGRFLLLGATDYLHHRLKVFIGDSD